MSMKLKAFPGLTFIRSTPALVTLFLLLAALAAIGPYRINSVIHPHCTIAGLREAGGEVELQGVVTYVDAPGKRVWIQDETGALQLNSSAHNIQAGEVVQIKARAAQESSVLTNLPASGGLTDVRVIATGERHPLPAPIPATLAASVQRDFGGLRVQLTGVLRAIAPEASGRKLLTFGNGSSEVEAVVPPETVVPPLNTLIQVTGVAEGIPGPNRFLKAQRLWVQASSDLHAISRPSTPDPVHSIRSLFADPQARSGYRIRLRARIADQSSPTAVDVEDRWGIVGAELDTSSNIAVGSVVEITGFPRFFGFRLEIQHASIVSLTDEPHSAQKYRGQVLRSVVAVRHLAPAEANGAVPVRLDGVVTFADVNWQSVFVQDSTGGIYVSYSANTAHAQPGDRVTVVGLSNQGDYAPVVAAAKLIHRGRASLPQPLQLTPREAASGALDSVFVEIEGVVHAVSSKQDLTHVAFSVDSPSGAIRVVTSPSFGSLEQLRRMEDATARIRGICGAIFNSRRQFVGYQLLLSSIEDIWVIAASHQDPFALPPTPINQLLRYSPNAAFNHRVTVAGMVTMVGDGYLYMQDETGGVRVESNTQLRTGARVKAAGYAAPGAYSPVLREAEVQALPSSAVEVKPITLDWNATATSDSRLVTVDGRVLSVINALTKKTLVLDSGGRVFDAQLYIRPLENIPLLQEGAIVRLTGISASQTDTPSSYLLDPYADPGVRILLRSPQDIRILKPAPWWNLRHTVFFLSTLLGVILASFAALSAMRRRMLKQQIELRQASKKAQAIQDLTSAMQEVTREKRFTSRVTLHPDNEIASLGAEFNKMLTELHARDLAKSEAERKLKEQALTDELTGLPNRRLLSDRLRQLLELARREMRLVAVLYIDLDGFKLANDSFGHASGDDLLHQVAQRLLKRIRKSDTVARLGGDEFAVVLGQIRSREEAVLVANNLVMALSEPFNVNSHEVIIGASIGISIFPHNAADAEQLLQQADSAMYAAKRSGKNTAMLYTSEIGCCIRERSTLEAELRGAIARGEIHLHYQPEFDLATHKVVRFEALARWTHPTLGSIPPDKFIPIAEETGLIIPLGAFVLHRACSDAIGWQKMGQEPVQVAVNVSSVQFLRATFVNDIKQVLARTGLQASLLQLELTESAMLDGPEYAIGVMQELRSLGISLAIDDFGTGYSCFSYLPRLPFNTLKIDRSFIREAAQQPEMQAMIHSLVALAHNLKMQVVVEGIETREQLQMIEALGGNQVQGFLFGRPTATPVAILEEEYAFMDVALSH